MHRWDSRLRPPPGGIEPQHWRDTNGEPTKGQLRGPYWRRSTHGLYVPSDIPLDTHQRIVEAAALLPGYGAIGSWASAYWLGVRLLDGLAAGGRTEQPVLLCLGPDGKIRKRPGIALSRELLPDTDLTHVRGLPCTASLRTAFDGARLAHGLWDAVIFIDMMLTTCRLCLADLFAYTAERRGWRGVPQARRAVTLAVDGSKSPAETRLRLVWVLQAGLPTPLVNRPVFSLDGQLLGFPDLLDPESATVGEYDSDDHRELDYHTDDNFREELFEDHGLIVSRMTRLDMAERRRATITRLQRARSRGLRRDRSLDR